VSKLHALLLHEVRRLLLLLAAAGLVAWWQHSLWPLVGVLGACLAFYLWQLARLQRWLQRYPDDWEPPESSGAWGELFNGLYRLLRRENLARDDLAQLIRRTESSLSAMRDGVVLLDRRQQLETWNQAAALALGLRMASDRRQAFTNFVRDPRMIEYLQVADFRQPLSLPSPAQPARMLEYSITRFGAGEYLLLIRDVTRLHRLEQMRKDFVANVSHELKTPLTVFKGYLETLLDCTPDSQPALRRALEQMEGQSQRMERLIQDLLWLAQLEGSEVQATHQPVSLSALCASVVAEHAALAADQRQQVVLAVPEHLQLLGDADELRSALTNLLVNAIHYSGEHSRIELCWQAGDNGGCLAVRDNGPGIAAHHLPRLSERFYRPDPARITATGGTGLGLAIVKHVLLRHDAQLKIDSSLGQGSCFACCFPPHRVLSGPAPELG
jgi:two-component system phosphate regulon sensor histidine kinase PhoR